MTLLNTPLLKDSKASFALSNLFVPVLVSSNVLVVSLPRVVVSR
jgi:hypothetical protein